MGAARVNRQWAEHGLYDEGDLVRVPCCSFSGNPTWGFLYRDFIGPLTNAGYPPLPPIGLARVTPIIHASTRRSRWRITSPISSALIDQLDLADSSSSGRTGAAPKGSGRVAGRVEKLDACVWIEHLAFQPG